MNKSDSRYILRMLSASVERAAFLVSRCGMAPSRSGTLDGDDLDVTDNTQTAARELNRSCVAFQRKCDADSGGGRPRIGAERR